ncbi:MAG: polyhydroxyalkanoate granule-associated phasin [Aquisalimonadaceae bacterium]
MDLGWKTAEMLAASAQVISRRTNIMTNSGTSPTKRDQREFTRMGQEKLEAAAESTLAMASQMMSMNFRLWTQAFEQMLQVATATMSLMASGTISQSIERQKKLGAAVSRSVKSSSRLSSSAARLAQRGLDPVHARATANARRLRG